MTMAEALYHAQKELGPLVSEDVLAERAATVYIAAASPEERERLAFEGACEETFEVIVEEWPRMTAAQRAALELIPAQAQRIAERWPV